MSTPAVVVPWLGGCPYRERNWRYCRDRWQYPIVEAPGAVPWSKGLAVAPELRRLRCEVVVIADADVLIDRDALEVAVDRVASGAARWAVPHTLVRRLTDAGTECLMRGEQPASEEEPAYPGLVGGGVVVLRREDALAVPIDPRFVGWGSEDDAWGVALATLLGDPWRGDATLTHLWHPPQARMNRRRGSVESWRLRRRYFMARVDPDEMRTLLKEAEDALPAPNPAVHDHATARVV